MTDHKDWIPIWRGVATAFLRDGYCPLRSIEKWVRGNNLHLGVARKVLLAMAVEGFDHEGELHVRLSGKVVPLLPRDVRNVRVYRQAGAAA